MNPNHFYFAIGFSLLFIYGVKEELLIRDSTYKVILVLSSGLFVVGIVLHFTPQAANWGSGALLAPLFMLLYFRLCLRLFVRWVHREPIDVHLNWTPGLVKDRAFAFAFFFGGAAILMVTMLVMYRLAKAGL